MIMKILKWVLIATIVFAIYKIVGGDLGEAMSAFLDFLYNLLDRTSDWVVSAWNKTTS